MQDLDSEKDEELNMGFEAIEDLDAKEDKETNMVFEANTDPDMLGANEVSIVMEGYRTLKIFQAMSIDADTKADYSDAEKNQQMSMVSKANMDPDTLGANEVLRVIEGYKTLEIFQAIGIDAEMKADYLGAEKDKETNMTFEACEDSDFEDMLEAAKGSRVVKNSSKTSKSSRDMDIDTDIK